MMNNFLGLNIVFIPPEEISDYSISLCTGISRQTPLDFMLDGRVNFPHITIYQLSIPNRNLKDLILKLERISNRLSPLDFKFIYFKAFAGFIGASFLPSPEILEIQEQIVQTVSDLREGSMIADPESGYAKELPKEQIEVIKKFGFDNLFEFYNPHITVAKVKDIKKGENIAEQLKWTKKEFRIDSIGVYTLGEFGTCKKLLKEFKLKGAG